MKEGPLTFKEKKRDIVPDAEPSQRRKVNSFSVRTAVRFSEITMKTFLKKYTRYARRVMMNERKITNARAAAKNLARDTIKQFAQFAWRNSTSTTTGHQSQRKNRRRKLAR